MKTDRDIAYRIMILGPAQQQLYWYRMWSSLVGECGARLTLQGAKKSARSAGLKKGDYEIWKIHVGIPSAESPHFPPEKVV